MWRNFLKILTFSIFFNIIFCKMRKDLAQIALEQEVVSIKNYVFWPNATVPFYVNPEHFDHEQSLAILTALSMFAFKSCLKFAPVMAAPQSNEHVMVFENPNGIRRCTVDTVGHSVFEPHGVVLGYDCLQSPNIDMMIMRSLGFPFEHNKPNRGVYIDVLHENIEPGHTDLFTVEAVQAMELSALPYDVNSVMHFGDREYSKNGHRTIMFKDPNMRQNRIGLTHMDLRKIDAVYGPECRTRDRQEKLDLCQSYPGVARRKREARPDEVKPAEVTVEDIAQKDIELDKGGKKEVSSNTENVKSGIENESGDKNVEIKDIAEEQKREDSDKQGKNVASEQKDIKIDVTKSLRINPNITPPPHVQLISLNTELGIADGLQDLVDNVFKISKLALNNAREKYCFNNTIDIKPSVRSTTGTNATDTDILGIVDLVVQYVNAMVNNAKTNLTQFCQESESIDRYSRSCHFGSDRNCPQTYRSTKSGPVQHSTQHRPTFFQSTRVTYQQRNIFDNHNQGYRKKRSVDVEAVTDNMKKEDNKVDNNDIKNDVDKAKDIGNYDNVKTNVTKAQDDISENNVTKKSNRDEDEVVIKRNKGIDKDGEETNKYESNNETRGDKNDVEINIKNKNETEDINQAEEMKNSKEFKKFVEKLTMNVNHQPNRRRDRHYRRSDYDSSVSAERDKNLKYKGPSSEVDEELRDPRQNQADLKRIEREKIEKKQLKHRLELKRQRDEEYDKKFQKHLPEWSNEIALKRDEYTTKSVISSTYTVRISNKVKNTPTPILENERKIKKMIDRKGNKRIEEDSELKWSKVKKLEPVETYEREREKYSDTEAGKYNKPKDSDAEYEKVKVDDEEEAEYKRPEKTKPKETKYDEQESVESEQREKRMTSKKPRQKMTMKMKKESDGESVEKIKKKKKTKEDYEMQQSVEDEIANRKEKSSIEHSREISRMNLPRLVKLTKENEEFYKDRRWPGGEVRYLIQEDTTYDTEDLRNRIEEVNDILKEKTCVSLKEVTEDQATEYEDYLVIDNSPDYVTGRVGGRQKFGSIELFRGNQHRQHTAMMVMAWLGFYFEVSRHDRDKYVRVHNRHIRPDKLHHFEKIRDDATLNLPYDYASATQPAWQYWRQIGRKGISTVATYKHKDPDGKIMKAMGQNEKLLSDIDIVKINSVYGLSCKRHERAEDDATTNRNKNPKLKSILSEETEKKQRDTSSSDSSSSSSEDLSE